MRRFSAPRKRLCTRCGFPAQDAGRPRLTRYGRVYYNQEKTLNGEGERLLIRVAICDDEPAFVAKVEELTRRFFDGQGVEAEISRFTSPLAFVTSGLAGYDLVLLDVSMQELDGIQAAKALREQNQDAILIFLSAYVNYAIMGYAVRAFSYLLKEELAGTFATTMGEVLRELRHRKSSVTVTIQNQPVTLELARLVYLESRRHLLCAHLTTGAELEFYGKLQDWEAALAPEGFLRIQKSMLVNMDLCRKISNYQAYMANGERLQCSRQNYTQLVEKLLGWKGR